MAKEMILIVEDELIIAEDLRMRIEGLGYRVTGPAKNYTEALAILEKEQIDLALLDINLSGSRSGIELAHLVRERYSIPFLFLTSYSDRKTVEKAKVAYPAGYIVKPFKTEDLFTSIEVALAGKKRQEASQDQSQVLAHSGEAIMVKDGRSLVRIRFKDILFVQADGNYVAIHSREKRRLVRHTFKRFRERLPENLFCQVHKSYIVNIQHIAVLEREKVIMGDQEVPVSRNFFSELHEKFMQANRIG